MTDSEAAPRPELRDLLRANMFDGDEDGTVTMPIATLLDEVVDIIATEGLPYREIGYTAEECERVMRKMTNGERGCANPDDHLASDPTIHMLPAAPAEGLDVVFCDHPRSARVLDSGGWSCRRCEQFCEPPAEGLPPCDRCGSTDRWLHYRECGMYYFEDNPAAFLKPAAPAEGLDTIDGCIAIVQQSLDTVRGEDDGESRTIKTSIAAREHVIALLTAYREQYQPAARAEEPSDALPF